MSLCRCAGPSSETAVYWYLICCKEGVGTMLLYRVVCSELLTRALYCCANLRRNIWVSYGWRGLTEKLYLLYFNIEKVGIIFQLFFFAILFRGHQVNYHHFHFPAQLVGGFTLNDLLDKPWSQVSSLPPDTCLQCPSRIGFSIPTARRFASNVATSNYINYNTYS